MKIIITGFKPFLGETINPSEKLALDLESSLENVQSFILPVEFKKSFEILKTNIESSRPDYLIMIGQAAGRSNICLEKIALNWVQTEHKDESGYQPITGPILKGTDLALMSKFPIEPVFFDLKKNHYPIEVSFSAGTFVCNDLYFRVMNQFKNLKAVFVHVPLLPEQLKKNDLRPSLNFKTQLSTFKHLIGCQALFPVTAFQDR